TDECGVSHYKRATDRIIGGRDAKKGEFPWMISVQVKHPHSPGFVVTCGAAIINTHWVLTAAHCLENVDKNDLQIVAGAHDIKDWTEGMSKHTVSKLIAHHDYNKHDFGVNDIALIKVNQEFRFNASKWLQNSVCLPAEDYNARGRSATATGWGAAAHYRPPARILKAIDMPVLNQDECRLKHIDYVFLKDTQICCGGQLDRDTCFGDSGGPVIEMVNNRAVLVGITVGSPQKEDCGVESWPGIYTDVTKYIKWINDNMKG
ncbi:unnamed protein product, partial [Medioppia subpectinata]